jgi:hypothetical protein
MTTLSHSTRGARRRERWTLGFLAVWAAGASVVMATLMASHWVALPRPERDDARLNASLASLPRDEQHARWRMHHVLYAECGCSRRVLEHVATRARTDDVDEIVLLVGEDAEFERLCRENNLRLEQVSEEQLEQRFGVEAAPLLVISDPSGATRYCGGYTDRKGGLAYQDLATLARLRAGEQAPPLPVYGCGVTNSLQAALDPLGLKY